MEEFLHQLIWRLSHFSWGFTDNSWCRTPSINSRFVTFFLPHFRPTNRFQLMLLEPPLVSSQRTWLDNLLPDSNKFSKEDYKT